MEAGINEVLHLFVGHQHPWWDHLWIISKNPWWMVRYICFYIWAIFGNISCLSRLSFQHFLTHGQWRWQKFRCQKLVLIVFPGWRQNSYSYVLNPIWSHQQAVLVGIEPNQMSWIVFHLLFSICHLFLWLVLENILVKIQIFTYVLYSMSSIWGNMLALSSQVRFGQHGVEDQDFHLSSKWGQSHL